MSLAYVRVSIDLAVNLVPRSSELFLISNEAHTLKVKSLLHISESVDYVT